VCECRRGFGGVCFALFLSEGERKCQSWEIWPGKDLACTLGVGRLSKQSKAIVRESIRGGIWWVKKIGHRRNEWMDGWIDRLVEGWKGAAYLLACLLSADLLSFSYLYSLSLCVCVRGRGTCPSSAEPICSR
jgi:hypothetical protein